MTRLVFGGLALVDALLLAYLAFTYDWFAFDIQLNLESPGALFAGPVLWMILIGEKLCFATFFYNIGRGIYREITGKAGDVTGISKLATPVLVFAIAGIGAVWIYGAARIMYGPPGFLIDRLTMFDGLAGNTNEFHHLFGTTAYLSGSIGRYLVILLGAAYLAEKYLFALWKVRWPVPILPVAAIAWVMFTVRSGETRLLAWVDQQQWRPVTGQLSWIDAVATR